MQIRRVAHLRGDVRRWESNLMGGSGGEEVWVMEATRHEVVGLHGTLAWIQIGVSVGARR